MKTARWILTLFIALAVAGAGYQAPKAAKEKQASAKTETSARPKTRKQLDINSASADDLKSLPGIGDAYSAAIIKNRPYANKRQLVSRKVIPQATYDKISDRIIASQSKGK